MSASATVFAWLVHLYTALGLVCAAAMAVLIVRGGDASFRRVFLLMLVATAIDATDGWLARRARVKEVLPGFSGRTLDDLIDFQTYSALPLLLLWRSDVFPGALAWVLLIPLLASAYGFSQVNVKTDEGFFLGFPSYWNIVAFYIYMLQPPVAIAIVVLITFAALTFVPTPYLYATQGGPFAVVINGGAVAYFIAIVWVLIGPERQSRTVTFASLLYPAAYLVLSAVVAVRARRHKRSA